MRLRFEGPAGGVGSGVGGGVGRGRLHCLVGHDPGCKLLLGLLEAGARGAVEGVHLEPTERNRRWWASNEFPGQKNYMCVYCVFC